MSNPHIALALAAALLSGCNEPDIAWNCGQTIIGYADQDLGPSVAGSDMQGNPIGNDSLTILWVVKPPAEGFVFKLHSTPHAYATWRAELNGKPCERRPMDLKP
jgi:hypothetical protein